MIDFTSPFKALEFLDRVVHWETSGPVCVHLSLTNVCNHECVWCEPLKFRKENYVGLSEEVVFRVLRELVELDTVSLQLTGGGEPTVCPFFGDILKEVTQPGKFRSLGLVTNGQRLGQFSDHLLDRFSIRVSLDALNPSDHSRLHQVSINRYEEILDNIRFISSRKRSTQIGIGFLIYTDNDFSEEKAVPWIERRFEEGLDFISFRPVYETGYLNSNKDKTNEIIKARFLNEVVPILRKVSVRFPGKIWFNPERMQGVWFPKKFTQCRANVLHTQLAANGQAYICCNLLHPYGNFIERPFKELWFGPRVEYIRTLKPHENSLCNRCVLSEYNTFLERYLSDDSPARFIY